MNSVGRNIRGYFWCVAVSQERPSNQGTRLASGPASSVALRGSEAARARGLMPAEGKSGREGIPGSFVLAYLVRLHRGDR